MRLMMNNALKQSSPKYSKSLDSQTEFVLVILIGGTVWAHRKLIPTIEKWVVITLITVISLILALFIYKLITKRINRKDQLLSNISIVDKMSGLEFEKFLVRILKKNGFSKVRLTEKYDLGVDIIAEQDGIRWGIQAKRYSGLVKADAVRQVVTALNHYKCDRGMVITNSYFSKVAIRLAHSNDCVLINRESLINKIHEACID